ncbi:phthiocerol/phthiodiolone dimycocerosyl transferase family protein [Phormidium sp. CCY1219]|uniref:phthiocerol/phthiodiolone dimycocerosyl transferase family protein n=1 Tax=Phormidium sp. CCY1219 TaxID=2886104 RepID=UPI002D1E8EE1|nr:condensation domain-containing protein [Phormidium sp. CCY1219]MEB3828002.1 condensation domain-containing protein [Phormidium sp. CCY1219]
MSQNNGKELSAIKTTDRPLGALEQAMEILNSYSGTFNIATVSKIKGTIPETLLRKALDTIQKRHPRLQSRIVESANQWHFQTEGTQPVPLRILEVANEEQLQQIVEGEVNEKIESSKGLLRCLFVKGDRPESSSYLITTIHHAISDGISSIHLHSEILKTCQEITSTGDSAGQISPLPCPKAIEEILPKWMKGVRGKLQGIWFVLQVKVKQRLYKPETFPFEKTVPLQFRKTGIVQRKLDPGLTQNILQNCRQNTTTVQGALCTAMLFTAARKIRGEEDRDVRVVCRNYVDLRRYLNPPVNPEDLAIMASSLTAFHQVKPNGYFWELAQEVRQKLKKGLDNGAMFKPIFMFRKIIESLLATPNQSSVTVAVSNVGRVNIPRNYGELELEEISFVPGIGAFGGIFAVAVTTFREKMTLNFMFSDPSISHKTIESLADEVVVYLKEACQ